MLNESLAMARRAETLLDMGRTKEALALAGRAAFLAPERGEGYAACARAYRALGRTEEALEALAALIRRCPRSAPAHDALGVMLSEAGRLEEARAAFGAALACDPAYARAYFGLATLGRVATEQLAAMEELAVHARMLDESQRLFLLYALVKAYDEAGDVDRAFVAAEAGATIRRLRWRGDFDAEMARLKAAAPGAAAATGQGDPTERLVFVFGLPRSGTTLVEQILARHEDAYALGETEFFARQSKRRGGPIDLARAYLAALPDAARGARRIVDKSLGSVLHINTIRAAFPRARLVAVRRDPLDVGLSCHFTYFQHDLPFPPDLEAFGRYARAHADLLDSWKRASPPESWRDLSYEALVADPERESQALLAFVGLDWRPQCLDFAGADREIRTASLAQAREAPHVRSVGRWRRYEAFLQPLRRRLGAA